MKGVFLAAGIKRFLIAAIAASVGFGAAHAQTYPTKPITIVVPFAAGGPTDTIARIFAERLRIPLGQTVVVENTTGAAGTLGVGRVARAAPDGYTIGIGHWSTHVVNPAVYTLQYDVLKDFSPISLIANNPQIVIAKAAAPAGNLKEFIAWVKANQDKITAGTAGAGSASHVAGVYFQSVTGTKFQFVPYRGAGPAMQDMVAGQIDIMFDQAANSLPQIRGGKIKGYAVTQNKRLVSGPDIPTVDEAGLPNFYISVWHGLWAPKNTPKEIVAKLNAAVRQALADEKVRQRLVDLGQDIPPVEQQTPQALYDHHKAEIEKWWPIIKAAGIKPE
jgi:tripartite-type tricarboxylate transporter receptor subunit TctC